MLKETMDNFELETEIHLRAEGIEAMIAMLDLGINGDGGNWVWVAFFMEVSFS